MFGNRKSKKTDEKRILLDDELLRRKKVYSVITCCLWIVVAVGLSISIYCLGKSALSTVLDKLVYKNDFFTLRTLDIVTIGGISRDKVLEVIDIHEQIDNVMALDLNVIKQKLESVSTVSDVSVERVIPDTIRVQVSTRIPIAHCNLPEIDLVTSQVTSREIRYLDEEGYVLVPSELFSEQNTDYSDLPLITGFSEMGLLKNHYVANEEVMQAIEFIKLYHRSFMSEDDDISSVDTSESGFLKVRTLQGITVILSATDLQQEISRWKSIYDYAKEQKKEIATINLSVTNNIPVVWKPTQEELRQQQKSKKRVGR